MLTVALGLGLYRALTGVAGALLAAPLDRLAPAGGTLRGALAPLDDAALAARGSVWIHAASMGEMLAGARWAETLVAAGARTPLFVTARTATGLARARILLDDRAVTRIAPVDLPGRVRAVLRALAPARLDIVETELWPNLLLEARRAGVPVAFVSATVSGRTSRRLACLGLSGRALLGDGVWVLAQSAAAAERFRALGVPDARVAVAGDLKAEPPPSRLLPRPSQRPLVVFGSFRPGEEEALVAAAAALEGGSRRLVVAPRHPAAAHRASRALAGAGSRVLVRGEAERAGEPVGRWLARVAASPDRTAGLLATRGELAWAYEEAAVAIVGGTFAAYGGHNALEPAARGCAVLLGPHRGEIAAAVDALGREGAVLDAASSRDLGRVLGALLREEPGSVPKVDLAGAGARRAATEAARAAERTLEALRSFGLER